MSDKTEAQPTTKEQTEVTPTEPTTQYSEGTFVLSDYGIGYVLRAQLVGEGKDQYEKYDLHIRQLPAYSPGKPANPETGAEATEGAFDFECNTVAFLTSKAGNGLCIRRVVKAGPGVPVQVELPADVKKTDREGNPFVEPEPQPEAEPEANADAENKDDAEADAADPEKKDDADADADAEKKDDAEETKEDLKNNYTTMFVVSYNKNDDTYDLVSADHKWYVQNISEDAIKEIIDDEQDNRVPSQVQSSCTIL